MAMFLGVLMIIQVGLFTGPTGAATGTPYDVKDKGTPSAAFDSLTIAFDEKVTDKTKFGFRLDGVLDEDFTKAAYESFTNDGGMTEAAWNANPGDFASYDEYLDAVPDEKLPDISFTVELDFPQGAWKENQNFEHAMTTTSNVKVGSLKLETGDGTATLTGTFNKRVYKYLDVNFGGSAAAELTYIYEEDTTVEVTPGGNDSDFVITIPDGDTPNPGNGEYKITKEAELGSDNRTITYTIHATVTQENSLLRAATYSEIWEEDDSADNDNSDKPASDSEITDDEDTSDNAESDDDSDSVASESEISKSETKRKNRARKKVKKVASASQSETNRDKDYDEDRTLDPENEEDWEEEGDGIYRGPGVFAEIIDKMVPKQYTLLGVDDISMGESLREKEISDAIPADLEITKVEKSSDGTSYSRLDETTTETGLDAGHYFYSAAGVLKYVIQDETDEFYLKITTRVSDSKYQAYMLASSAVTWTFTNRAYLNGSNDSQLADSGPVETVINLPAPFTKNGDIVVGAAGKIEWTLNVNSSFSNPAVELWAVDHIADVGNTHNYITADGIKVGTEPRGIVKYFGPPLTGPTDTELTGVRKVNDLLTQLGALDSNIANRNPKSAIVYEYDAGNGKTDAVMLIPLTADKNKKLTITYQTQANLSSSIGKELSNSVKIMWKWPDGQGPGGPNSEVEFGSASIEKKVTLQVSLIGKTAGSYNATTNEIPWTIEINQAGVAATDVTITDTLGDGKLSLVEPGRGVGSKLQLIPIGSGAIREIPYVEPGNWPANGNPLSDCYTVFVEGDREKLVVYLKNLGAGEHYNLYLRTFVGILDYTGAIGNYTQLNPIQNACSVKATMNGTPIEFNTKAEAAVLRILIGKIAVNDTTHPDFYDYKANTVKWQVEFNKDSWKIKDVVISDRLPEGTHFAKLTDVLWGDVPMQLDYIPAAGEDAGWTETAPPKGIWRATKDGLTIDVKQDNRGEKLICTFSENFTIDKPFTFKFTNYVEEERRNKFTSKNMTLDEQYGPNNPNLLHNNVEINGKMEISNGRIFPVKAAASGTNIEGANPMLKSGKYVKLKKVVVDGVEQEVYAIDWKLYVNRVGNNLGGATVTDIIQPGMELMPELMKVSTVQLKPDGTETGVPSQIFPIQGESGNGGFSTLDKRQFVYEIPQAYATNTLKFEFTTLLVEDTAASEMINNVSLRHGDTTDSTGNVTAEGAETFRTDFYANARGTYFVTIAKKGEGENGTIPLAGATFEIYQMHPPASYGDRGDINQWQKPLSPMGVRTSNAEGKLNFLFLKSDTMYKIVEKTAPDGYELIDEDSFSWYVIPKVSANSTEIYPANPDQTGDSATYTVLTNRSNQNYLTFDVKNKREDPGNTEQYARLQLNKALGQRDGDKLVPVKDSDGNYVPIQGVRFNIYSDLAGTGIPAPGQTPYITGIITNSAGQLQFPAGAAKKLIVGNYILEEEGGGNYASVPQAIPFTVSAKTVPEGESFTPDTIYIGWDGKDYSVTVAPDPAVSSSIRFLNVPESGQIQGMKTTDDNMTPLSGAAIGLFPAGTTSFTEANLWNNQKAVSGADGLYSFRDIPYGTYIVAELSAPPGYELNTAARYEVTVSNETVKTTGFLMNADGSKNAAESPITIANKKTSQGGGDETPAETVPPTTGSSGGGGGGGGGGGTKPQESAAPGTGGETLPPSSANPGESNPGGTVVIPPDTPPGSDFEVKDPDGNTVLEGKTDENGQINVDLPPGEYTLITFDENKVPLASMQFQIEDNMTPLAQLAAPSAGDHSVPIVLLGVMMLVSLSGIIVISRRKKSNNN